MPIVTLLALVIAGLGWQTATHEQDSREPQFDYSDTLGCGNVFFHAVNSAKTEILRIEIDFARLRSSASRHTFDLAKPVEGIVVDVTLYRHRQINRPNCSDLVLREVGAPPNPPQVWRSVAGRLEVERGSKGIRPDEPWLFRATIGLTGAKFRGPGDRVVEMPNPFRWEGFVGWQAG